MNSGESRRTEEMYEHGLTVPRTDPSSTNIDKNQDQPVDTESYPNKTNDDTLLNNMKEGVKHAAEKVADGVRKHM
uniref:Uncharacterized protein n=1 Tax=Panagrolaimus sp. PS1159 TaxID=55785 RepID=A0AC35FB73_9BILA